MSERSAVQNPMLKYADAIGWQYVAPDEAVRLRSGETGLYFTDILKAQLLRLNPGVVNEERAQEIIRRLNLLKPDIKGNEAALKWLRGEESVFVPEENRERNVRLIDFDNPSNNQFHVTDEWTQQNAVFRNRADVVYLINGIPVAVCETKAAAKNDGLEEGIAQVRRYHRETPELLIAAQVFEVTHLIGFWYGGTWSLNRKNLFNWKEEVDGDYERKVKAFFDRVRFLRVLRDYIIFLTRDDELSKMILRQHQTRAVEKAITRFHEPQRRHSLVWHTQGSGKTLTMITIAACLLRDATAAEKPTVLMLVDRNELEAQLFRNIAGYGIKTVEVAQSKRDLQQILKSDYRGLIVSAQGFDDKAKERAIEYFTEKSTREEFYKFFRQLQNLHEIISPDAFMRPFIDDFEKLAELFTLIRNAYSTRPYVDKELTQKTRELLRARTGMTSLEVPSAIYELGQKELEALKRSDVADTTKILNLKKALAITVDAEGQSKPFLLSIGERAEAVAELYEDRRISTEEALADFEKLAREAVEAEAERQKLNVDENTFAIYITLRVISSALTVKQAQSVNAIFISFPDYRWNKQQEQQLRAALYKVLRPLVGKNFIATTDALLKLKRV